MTFSVYMVGMMDATDECFNIGSWRLQIRDGETAAEAWKRLLRTDYDECWTPDDWGDDEGCDPFVDYSDWQENKCWAVTLSCPDEAVEAQNSGNQHMFDGAWMNIEDALKVVDALRGAAEVLGGDRNKDLDMAEASHIRRWRAARGLDEDTGEGAS